MTRVKKLIALLSRRDFVARRIAGNRRGGKVFGYDYAERDALAWAIEELRNVYPNEVAAAEAQVNPKEVPSVNG